MPQNEKQPNPQGATSDTSWTPHDWIGQQSKMIDEAAAASRASRGHQPSSGSTGQRSAPTGEVSGLGPALSFAAGMVASMQSAATETEAAIAALQTGGVSGDSISGLQQAMECLGQAAAGFEAAHLELQRHTEVGEAYVANPGAGSREFITSE